MNSEGSALRVAEFLVVDSGGFIKNAPLHEFGKELFTLRDVISEIKDKATKQRLQALPYELQYQEPDSVSLQRVTEFARKTGDYGSLSLTDLKVLALTYMLEAKHSGTSHLNQEPTIRPTVEITPSGKPLSKEVDETGATVIKSDLPVGFVNPPDEDDEDEDEEDKLDGDDQDNAQQDEIKIENGMNESEDVYGDEDDQENSEDGDNEEGDSDDDGWITPMNVQQKKLAMFGVDGSHKQKEVKVACLTTDFAMQNVLLQMGLNVASVDGVIIHETKTWIKRCYACFKTVPDVSKEFCPKCGNKTLKRVSVTLDADGTMKIHISGRRKLTGRGKKFSLPTPQGGKHALNPILCPDQPLPQQFRSMMARAKTNALDPDYIAGSSPFSINDVTSRSAMMNIGGQHKHWMKRNPNEVGRKTGNRKKKS